MSMTKQKGLEKLAASEGMGEMDLLEKATFDGVASGICLECGYTTTVEPDSSEGFCEVCGTSTVQSCLVLAGVI